MFKLTTLNLNGIRSAARKGLLDWVDQTAPDCMCVQELKAQTPDMDDSLQVLGGMQGHFHCAQKKGYSGVGIYSRLEPSEVIVGFDGGEFDDEGRYVEARFDRAGHRFSVVSAYFPSGSSGDERQDAKYRFLDAFLPHIRALMAQRTVVLCGDLNIAHANIDLKNWRSNQKNSGFLPEERAWLSDLLADGELVDVYRRLHPDAQAECYTWWSNRGRAWDNNVGWRLDYHLASKALAQTAQAAAVYKDQRFSDHAPLTVHYDWAL